MSDTTNPLDAMVAAPAHHRVVLENHRVRMLDSRAAGINPESGAVLWGQPPMPHAVRNVGTRELRSVAVGVGAAT